MSRETKTMMFFSMKVVLGVILLYLLELPVAVVAQGNNQQQLRDNSNNSRQSDDRDLQLLSIISNSNGSPNPCIIRSIIQAGSANCERVIVPTGFCQTCGVNTDLRPNSNGDYVNCQYLSRLESLQDGTINNQCMNKLDEYFTLNSCDKFRSNAMQRYKRWIRLPKFLQGNIFRKARAPSRQILDAFIYAMCELPCDCIPQYDANINIPSYDVTRGNCQGHAEVDLCAVYPNIKLIHGQYTNMTLPTNIEELPYVCPTLKQWRKDHPGQWFDLTPTPIEDHVETFLHYTIDATEVLVSPNNNTNVSQNALWQQCFYLEETQKRIVPIIQ